MDRIELYEGPEYVTDLAWYESIDAALQDFEADLGIGPETWSDA